MKPCKHLDYETNFHQCRLVERCDVRHWYRFGPLYEGAPRNVQFCKKRGRINEILACYIPGEKHCYEPGT